MSHWRDPLVTDSIVEAAMAWAAQQGRDRRLCAACGHPEFMHHGADDRPGVYSYTVCCWCNTPDHDGCREFVAGDH